MVEEQGSLVEEDQGIDSRGSKKEQQAFSRLKVCQKVQSEVVSRVVVEDESDGALACGIVAFLEEDCNTYREGGECSPHGNAASNKHDATADTVGQEDSSGY